MRFDVIDRGDGIPADDLPQVRRRFVRGSTARGAGNGLGLAIVNRIAADHGGALEITSEVGRGTSGHADYPEGGSGMRPRILIVEDDSSLAQIVRDNLLMDGFDVEWASQAERALGLYRSFVPDLVLLDVMLPDLERVRARRAFSGMAERRRSSSCRRAARRPTS